MKERKILMQQKIKRNKQKNQRYDLINRLPYRLTSEIEKCELIFSPEVDEILDKVNKLWNYDLHKGDFVTKYHNFRKEFSWEDEVIQYVQQIKIEEKQAYLFLGINDSPIFLVNGKWVIENFSNIWEAISYTDLWVFDKDVNYGVLVSRYGGYLEHDPNPKEILYAITKW